MRPVHLVFGAIITIAALVLLRPWLLGQHLMLQVAPLVDLLQSPSSLTKKITLWAERQSDLERQLKHSQQQLQHLSMLHGKLAHLQQENKELYQLLAIRHPQSYQWRAVHNIGFSPDAAHRHLLIEVEQATIDDTVIAEHGLVGIVTATSDHHATVRTILDGAIAIPVTNTQHTLAALVHGEGDRLRVDMIARSQAPNVGDVLFSSGAGGLIPQGIAVARVTSITPIPGSLFVSISAVPTARWQQHHWLAIAHHPVDSYSFVP